MEKNLIKKLIFNICRKKLIKKLYFFENAKYESKNYSKSSCSKSL